MVKVPTFARRRRKLALEPLEKRQLLTAYISELMVAPLFGSPDTDQYFELRGEPSAQLEQGSYLLVVNDRDAESDDPGSDDPGTVQAMFDLSGQQFGSNGFLVLQQQNSPHPLGLGLVAGGPAPNVLVSTAVGFSGLPDNLFSSIDGGGRLEAILGSNSYFLIQSSVAPNLGDDIDADDDGVIDVDGPAATWSVLDSISLHDNVFQGPVAYGQVVFVQRSGLTEPPVIAPEGAEVIYTEGSGYAARIGESIGHAADDWVVGTVQNEAAAGAAARYRLENGISGVPLPRAFTGRDIDHLGESNFSGGVRGFVLEERTNAAGDLERVPVEGVRFLADTNGNAVRDVLNYTANPDDFAVGTELTNVFPAVTLTTVGADNSVSGFNVQSEIESFLAPTGNRVFAQAGINWFNESERLRIDFYRPARSVGIEAIADSGSSATFGRLEAFNAAGESLGFVRSQALFGTSRQQLRLNYNADVIAYALAYSESSHLNSSPFGKFDDLRYSQSEGTAVTDENGEYKLEYLQPGSYEVIALTNPEVILTGPLPITPVTIDRFENFELSFVVTQNTPPTIDPSSFSIAENAGVGTSLGVVTAIDIDAGQTVTFSLDDIDSPVSIDPLTGELSVQDSSAFDFESATSMIVTVVATDSVGGFSSQDVEIQITDVNEPPEVNVGQYTVSEEADQGAAFGRLDAFDPEFPQVAPTFMVAGGTGEGIFSIGASSGVLFVADADAIDFEQTDSLTLEVAISDQSVPPRVTIALLTISISDANDPPIITSDSFEVSEDLAGGTSIGAVEFVEVDSNQTHTFRLLSGGDGLFEIGAGTGIISLIEPLDFETAATHELLVQIVDNGTPPREATQTISIQVIDVDEPAVLDEADFSLLENSPAGTEIGILSAVDPEGLTGLTFASIDTSNPTRLFAGRVELDPVSGRLIVANGAVLDAEGPNAILHDRVQILSGATVVGDTLLTLSIGDVNEPPSIAPQQFGHPKGLPSGRSFAVVEFSDPENGDVTIEVIGSSADSFGIDDSHRLFVLPGVTLDFTANPQQEVELRVTDSQGLSSTSVSTVFEAPLPGFRAPLSDQSFVTGSFADYLFPAAYRSESVRSLSVQTLAGGLPEGLRFDPVVARLSGIAAPSANGTFTIVAQILDLDGGEEILKEETFTLTITRPEVPLFNSVSGLDVDGNGKIEPLDALRVINFLARNGSGSALDLVDETSFFVDTNGNNQVVPQDALLIINFLSRRARGVGESELAGQSIDERDEENQASDMALAELLAEASVF